MVNASQSILKDIGLFKNRILNPLLDSEDIRNILSTDKLYTDDEWFGVSDDDHGVVYKQIFPYLYIDDTQIVVKSYICYEIDIPRVPTATMKDIKIIVWCICHRDCMNYSKQGYLGTRVDILSDAVERALYNYEIQNRKQRKSELGIGELSLESVTYISSTNKEYYGRQLIFSVPQFKR